MKLPQPIKNELHSERMLPNGTGGADNLMAALLVRAFVGTDGVKASGDEVSF
jgi:hypothetical protein